MNKKELFKLYSNAQFVWENQFKKRLFSEKTLAVICVWVVIIMLVRIYR